ncbi:hypothetical protein [Amycolatopsis methanolica]|uniref:hypothetical protein n=1 Tax=Amycolatopsis methanolica TaxID=1814 RepID=UPI0012E0AE63|nr:hypothetical protein [Amycolatopsis methanolica]
MTTKVQAPPPPQQRAKRAAAALLALGALFAMTTSCVPPNGTAPHTTPAVAPATPSGVGA